jgi:hypothetical protein
MAYTIKRMIAFDDEYQKLMFKRSQIEEQILRNREKIEKRISVIDREVVALFEYYMKIRENELYIAHNDYIVLSNWHEDEVYDEIRDAYFMVKNMDLKSYITYRLRSLERPKKVLEYEKELAELVKLWNGGIGHRCEHCGNVIEYGMLHESSQASNIDHMKFFQRSQSCATRVAYDRGNFASAFCFKYDL